MNTNKALYLNLILHLIRVLQEEHLLKSEDTIRSLYLLIFRIQLSEIYQIKSYSHYKNIFQFNSELNYDFEKCKYISENVLLILHKNQLLELCSILSS
jgi:hypothetical protein